MNKQIGSIILILLIILTLSSITSVMILQSGMSFKKQNTLSKLHQKANEIATTQSSIEAANIVAGVDFSLLPKTKMSVHPFENHQFDISQTTTTTSTIVSPINGYSLNSVYQTQMVEIKTQTSSSMVNSSNIINGFSCLLALNQQLANEIESEYSLDLEQDLINDVSYQFDSSNGKISRIDTTTDLFINLGLTDDQSFSRPQFALFNFVGNSKLVITFIVQNLETVPPGSDNIFYLLFDKALFDLQSNLPVHSDELIDLNTNPEFSNLDKGYFLKLEQGQLISSAITIFNHRIIFITQSVFTDPDTGLIGYTNKLVTIDLNNGAAIYPDIQEIESSTDLLHLEINPHNSLTMFLNSQFGTVLSLPGECRPVYQYEE